MPAIDNNPDLTATCATMDIIVILDESGSVSGFQQDVEDGVLAFVSSLVGTGIDMAVVEFSNNGRLVTNYVPVNSTMLANMTGYFNGTPFNGQTYVASGGTNWMEGMQVAVGLAPADLVLFFTDGNPTVYTNSGGSVDQCGNGSTTQQPEIVNPMKIANYMKTTEGTHMFMLGVGGVVQTNLERMSGTTAWQIGLNDITTSDYALGDFAELADQLQSLAFELCGTDVVLNKSVSNDTVCVGQTVQFTLQLTNTGTVNAAQSIIVLDTFPAGFGSLSIISGTGGCIATVCNPDRPANTLLWQPGNINPSSSATIVIQATVLSAGTLINDAWATGSNFDPVTDIQAVHGSNALITGVKIFDQTTDTEVTSIGNIINGDVINSALLPANYYLVVEASGNHQSVDITVNSVQQTFDNTVQYTFPLAGESNNNWNGGIGVHTLFAEVFAGDNGTGAECDDHTITFEIIDVDAAWNFTCSECTDVQVIPVGISPSPGGTGIPVAQTITSVATVNSIIVEIVYEGSNPGTSINVTDAAANTYAAPIEAVPGLTNTWVYRTAVPPTTSVSYSNTSQASSARSMVLYVFRDDPTCNNSSVGQFQLTGGGNNIVSGSVTGLPTGLSPRDLTINFPVSGLVFDNSYMQITATAGSVVQTLTYCPTSGPYGCCVGLLSVVLEDVPGNISTVSYQINTQNTLDPVGCGANGQTYVLASAVYVEIAPAVSAGADVAICQGTSTLLTASNGSSWLWNTGATTQSINVSPATTTNYTVTVTDIDGCFGTDVSTVTVGAAPLVNAGVDRAICSGASVTLTATGSGGTGPYTYNWGAAGAGQSVIVSPVTNTTYTVTVTDNIGCTATDQVNVTVSPVPGISIVTAATDLCAGGSTTLTATPTGGIGCSVQWQYRLGTSGTWTNLGSGGNSLVTSTSLAVGTHQYQALYQNCTAGSGCNSATSNVITVTIIADPALSISTSAASFSVNGSA